MCGVMVAGSAVPSMLHESASLRWKAASISVCSMIVNELVCPCLIIYMEPAVHKGDGGRRISTGLRGLHG